MEDLNDDTRLEILKININIENKNIICILEDIFAYCKTQKTLTKQLRINKKLRKETWYAMNIKKWGFPVYYW